MGQVNKIGRNYKAEDGYTSENEDGKQDGKTKMRASEICAGLRAGEGAMK